MEIYKYKCNKCGTEFEYMHGFQDAPSCTECGSKDVKQIYPPTAHDDYPPISGDDNCGDTP